MKRKFIGGEVDEIVLYPIVMVGQFIRERVGVVNRLKATGDTMSLNAVYSPEATEECKKYLTKRTAWIDSSGSLSVSVDLPPIELALINITGK